MPRVNYPLVSFGIPVYNEERFVGETIESLLAQDYQNIEIIICDNASGDGTEAICRKAAEQDPRIRYHRNSENIGLIANFNKVCRLSKGDFFMWVGAHDLMSGNFVSACVKEFMQSPQVVLCHGETQCLNEGRPNQTVPYHVDTRGLSQADRLRRIMLSAHSWCGICGLMRSSAFKQTRLFTDGISADIVLLAELSFYGEFRFIPSITLYHRIVTSHFYTPTKQELERLMSLKRAQRHPLLVKFPFAHFIYKLLQLIHHSKLSFFEKIKLDLALMGEYARSTIIGNAINLAVAALPERPRKFLRRVALKLKINLSSF